MSQPPQGQPPDRPDGQPPSGDQPTEPTQGGGWGQPAPGQPGEPQPGQGWGQPAGEPTPPPGEGGWEQTTQPVPDGFEPPPGQGPWGPPPAPGYGQQPTQIGGFGVLGQPPYGGGPPGSGGSGWGVPGGASAPGPRRSKKKNVIIAAVAALALIVVAAVVLVVTLGGDDDPGTTASAGSSSSRSAPKTSSSSPASSPPSSGGFSSSTPGGDDRDEFVSQLPVDFTDCAAGELAGDGDLAAASCGAARTQPGPSEAKFYLYPDVTTLDGVFQSDVTDEGLTEFADTADCSTGVGYGPWTYTDGTPGGKVACQISADGHVLVAWTDVEFLTEGVVRAPGSTQAEVSALYDWWTSNSDYQR